MALERLVSTTYPGEELDQAIEYVREKWEHLRGNARNGHHDTIESWKPLAKTSADGHLDDQDHEHPYILYLPNDYIYPGGRFIVQFYWDSYFIIQSLLLCARNDLVQGIIDNCFYMIDKYGMVTANRKRWAAGSQLPFLASMVLDLYAVTRDREWLRKAASSLEKELRGYWLNTEHLAYRGLSRYHCPPYFPRDAIAAITLDNEATWDLSPRFDEDDVLSLLPVDLNCNLFIYERALAFILRELGDSSTSSVWEQRAAERRSAIMELMWDEEDGLFYDFNFSSGSRKKVRSLATFSPLFASLADHRQAARVRESLWIFETPYGLLTCDHDYGYTDRQWNYPVGWAPLHWIVYNGLKNYGYGQDARRIASKWVDLNFRVWKETGKFYEKYDVVLGTQEVLTDRYSNQEGFGWTNAVFHALAVDLRNGLT